MCKGDAMTRMFRQIFGDDQFGLLVVTGMNEVYVTGASREGSSDGAAAAPRTSRATAAS